MFVKLFKTYFNISAQISVLTEIVNEFPLFRNGNLPVMFSFLQLAKQLFGSVMHGIFYVAFIVAAHFLYKNSYKFFHGGGAFQVLFRTQVLVHIVSMLMSDSAADVFRLFA